MSDHIVTLVCTLCGSTIDVLDCVKHADDHIRTLVRTTCKVTYDIDYEADEPKIVILYSPFG